MKEDDRIEAILFDLTKCGRQLFDSSVLIIERFNNKYLSSSGSIPIGAVFDSYDFAISLSEAN